MSKYEKALDEILRRQYEVCNIIRDCTECCVFMECAMAFGRYDSKKEPTEKEFIAKIKEVFILKMEE